MTNSRDQTNQTNPELAEKSFADLCNAHEKLSRRLRDPFDDPDEKLRLHVLESEVWHELESRTAADPPECPDCHEQHWSQFEGKSIICMECDLHLDSHHEEIAKQVDEFWQTVKTLNTTA